MIRSRCASGNAEVPANFYALSPSTPQPAPQAPTSRSPDIDHDCRSSTPIAGPTSPHRTRHRISRNTRQRDTFTRDTFPTADCQQPGMESPDQEQHSSPERPFREMPERVSSQPDTDSPARHRERYRMLLHYIELISEYQDTRRSEDVGAPSSDTDTPQQDTPDLPPPPGTGPVNPEPAAATCPPATPSSTKTISAPSATFSAGSTGRTSSPTRT